MKIIHIRDVLRNPKRGGIDLCNPLQMERDSMELYSAIEPHGGWISNRIARPRK
jgi:hypothetical protein